MNWFWDNIHLKKEERTGMLIFVSILFCLILVKWYLVVLYTPEVENYNSELFANVEYANVESRIQDKKPRINSSYPPSEKYWETKNGRKRKPQIENKKVTKEQVMKEALLFEFDPNSTSKDSLLLLGLGKYATNNITKYRAKGGKFKDANDLQKIYGIDSILFSKIYSYIKIKKPKHFVKAIDPGRKYIAYTKPKVEFNSIDINLADTTEFKKLKGIGKVYANRIVKFRNSLGGYFTINQIKDVWGISDSLFTAIKPYLAIDTTLVVKKNINQIDKLELVKHPYVDWKKAKVILSYRKMHGDYQSMEDFEKMHGISDAFVDTLKQYFVAK